MLSIPQNIMEQIEVAINFAQIIAINNGDEILYFTFTRLEYSSSSNTSSIDYHAFTGINITEFLTREKIQIGVDNNGYLNKFMKAIEPRKPMTVTFSKYTPFLTFGP